MTNPDLRRRRAGTGNKLRTFRHPQIGIVGQQANQLRTVAVRCVSAGKRTLAKKVLLATDHAAQAKIMRCHGTVGLLAHDNEADLGAQHMHGLCAIGRDCVFLPGSHDGLPKSRSMACGHVDFK